ncbi:MAG: hypothetical protein ABSH10_08480 [Phycisphaerae bacterium]|jgi:hypothetical protein
MRRRRKSLGLAVTEQGITAVEVGWNGPAGTILHAAALDFSDELNLSLPDALGRELKAVLRRSGFQASRCVIGLAASWIVAREKVVPATDADALRGALSIAAELEFASSPSDLSFDYVALPAGQGTAAMLVAAPRRVVGQLTSMARSAGLSVEAITVSAAAMATGQEASPAGRLILCLLPRGVEAVVQSGGGIRLIRHLSVRLDAPGAPFDALVGELRRLLALAPGGQESGLIQQVLMWDSIERDASFWDSLKTSLGLPWKLGQLASDLGVAVAPSVPIKNLWAQAAALACCAGRGGIDFLHSRLAPPARSGWKWRVGAAVAACAVLLGVGVYFFLDWHAKQQEVQTLKTQLSQHKDAIAQAKTLTDDVTFARTWYDHRPAVLDCLREITGAFPQEGKIWATSLVIRQDMQALLTGKAVNEAAALEVFDHLKSDPRLVRVKPLFIRQTGGTSRDVSFAVNLSLRGAD